MIKQNTNYNNFLIYQYIKFYTKKKITEEKKYTNIKIK